MDKPKLSANVTPIEWIGPDHPLYSEGGLIHYAHIPKEATVAQPPPIVVMVHGKAGDEGVMWIFKRAIPPHVAVVAPRAPLTFEDGGFLWFDHLSGVLRPKPDSLDEALKKLHQFIKSLFYMYPVDPSQLLLMGFSQGAALCLAFALRYPESIVGVASLAGAMPQPVDSISAARPVTDLPVFIAHGLRDETVSVTLAQQTRDRFIELEADVTYGEYQTGHKINTQALDDLKSWLADRF